MKSYPHPMTQRVASSVVILVSIFLILSGCSSVHSHVSGVADSEAVGIPYHLPIGQVQLDLIFEEKEQNGQKTIAPKVTTTIKSHPDPTATFVLIPSHNAWFNTQHDLEVTNGLLSSVGTIESGEADSAVLSLVETGIGIAKLTTGFGGFGAESEDTAGQTEKQPFLTNSPEPTQAEISYIYRELAGRSASANLISRTDGATAEEKSDLEGTGSMLFTTAKLTPVKFNPGSDSKGNARTKKSDLTEKTDATGIYTRTVIPYTAELTLSLDTAKLRALRKRAFDRELAKLTPELKKLRHNLTGAKAGLPLREEIVDRILSELKILRSRRETIFEDRFDPAIPSELLAERKTQLTDIDAVITKAETNLTNARQAVGRQKDVVQEIEASIAAAGKKELRYGASSERYKADTTSGERTHLAKDKYPLHIAHAVVVLPNPNSAVRVPVTRAPVGDTTNTLQFSNGLLTSYHSIQPSAAAEIAKIPVTALNKITTSLSDIFQFRVDLNTARLATKESDVDTFESLIELNERLDAARERQLNGPSEIEEEESTPAPVATVPQPGDTTTETNTQQTRANEPVL